MVDSIHYLRNGEVPHKIDLYESTVAVNDEGIPLLLLCQNWDTMVHYVEKSFPLDGVIMHFLNQVRLSFIILAIYFLKFD